MATITFTANRLRSLTAGSSCRPAPPAQEDVLRLPPPLHARHHSCRRGGEIRQATWGGKLPERRRPCVREESEGDRRDTLRGDGPVFRRPSGSAPGWNRLGRRCSGLVAAVRFPARPAWLDSRPLTAYVGGRKARGPPGGYARDGVEWLACTDPTPMLAFHCGKASRRKLDLYALACCRRVMPLLISKWMSVNEGGPRFPANVRALRGWS